MKINPIISKKNKTEDLTIYIGGDVKGRRINFTNFSGWKEVFIVLGVVAVFLIGYFAFQQFILKPKLETVMTTQQDDQSNQIKEQVGKLIDLYDAGDLSVVSISNIDNLKTENPDFYKRGKNGNFVLISSKRAILYDKERNIILNVASVAKEPLFSITSTLAPKP